jgi:hypothetical protein
VCGLAHVLAFRVGLLGALMGRLRMLLGGALALPADGQHMSCHVVWRREKRIGVAFD